MTDNEKRDIAKDIAGNIERDTTILYGYPDYKEILVLVAEYLLAWHKK